MELHECYRILEKQKELKIQYCEKHNLPIPEFTCEDDYWIPVEREPVKEYKEVVHGYWKKVNSYGTYECSVCSGRDTDCCDYYGTHDVREQDYCPYCGAKMDGEK